METSKKSPVREVVKIVLEILALGVVILLVWRGAHNMTEEKTELATTETPDIEVSTEEESDSSVTQFEFENPITLKYIEEETPNANQISSDLEAMIVSDFMSDALVIKEEVASDFVEGDKLVIATVPEEKIANQEYCGAYGQPVCVILYEHNGEVEVVQIVDRLEGQGQNYLMGDIRKIRFISDSEAFFLEEFGDAGFSFQFGRLLSLDNKKNQIIASAVATENGFQIFRDSLDLILPIETSYEEGRDPKVVYESAKIMKGEDELLALDGPLELNGDILVLDYNTMLNNDGIYFSFFGKNFVYDGEEITELN